MVERIANCRLVQEIGAGGMAVIYKAVQESLGRTVAIKALRSAVAQDPQLVARFEREAQSVATLQHENIIQIYDFHKQDGILFIVMEYVEGIDLFNLLDRTKRIPLDLAAIVAMQVARALDAAHYHGIIHRDIKPSNIMLSKQGGVKLMDFGIARDSNMPDLTEAGTGLGTPSYMSPEQILGEKLDFRSDLFALGIVLYQATTGQKPFVEDEHKTVMHKIRLEKHISPRRLNPDIPRELERIISRCMAKLPRDRYESTQDLVLALERFIARRVHMNYRSRLVLFLRSQGLVSEQEADEYLHPAVVGYSKADANRAEDMALRRVLRTSPLIIVAAALLVMLIHLLPVGRVDGRQADSFSGVMPPAAQGYLQIVANPWAEVWIDGTKVETTPIARKLQVPVGSHLVELRNPWLGRQTRRVAVNQRQTTRVRVDFDVPQGNTTGMAAPVPLGAAHEAALSEPRRE